MTNLEWHYYHYREVGAGPSCRMLLTSDAAKNHHEPPVGLLVDITLRVFASRCLLAPLTGRSVNGGRLGATIRRPHMRSIIDGDFDLLRKMASFGVF